MKQTLLVIAISFAALTGLTSIKALAQSSSPSPTPTESPSPSPTAIPDGAPKTGFGQFTR